jgi:hypothetical protein
MTDFTSRLLRAWMAACLLGGLSGCNVYRTSALDSYTQTTNPGFCTTTAGSYVLPKGELVMRIERKNSGADGRQHYSLLEGASASAIGLIAFSGDPRHRYCLDFLSNAFYADAIGVDRNAHHLLMRVYSNVVDRAKGVVEKVAEGVGTAVAAAAGGRNVAVAPDGTVEVVQLRFDPFDQDLLTQINAAIRFTGHCLYIEADGDPYVPFWMRNQCTSKKVYQSVTVKGGDEEDFDRAEFVAGQGRFGIFYKPLLPHTLVILKKDDPTSGQPWRVWKRKVIELPNRAPPFMIEVRRGLFTDRKTDIVFNDGILQSGSVEKKSEMNAVADILIKIAQVAVQIPAKALIISTNEAENRKELIATNQALIQTLNSLRAAQDDYAERIAGLTPEQKALLEAGGRSASNASRFETCIQIAAVSTREEAELICRGLEREVE